MLGDVLPLLWMGKNHDKASNRNSAWKRGISVSQIVSQSSSSVLKQMRVLKILQIF